MVVRRSRLTFAAVCPALLLLVFFTRSFWLTEIGNALVYDQGPGKADAAVVLGGDYWGHRITYAAELVKAGYVPEVLVSGPPGFYGMNESDVAIRYAVQHGYPAAWFIPVPHTATSTGAEAVALLDDLRRRNIRSFLLVTSNFHTARARRIFLHTERAMGGGPDMRTVAAPDQYFTAKNWWHSREGMKTTFMEWTKTITGAFGI